jgi:hypothetical protein
MGGFFDAGSFLSISVRPISCKSTGLHPPATQVIITGGERYKVFPRVLSLGEQASNGRY